MRAPCRNAVGMIQQALAGLRPYESSTVYSHSRSGPAAEVGAPHNDEGVTILLAVVLDIRNCIFCGRKTRES